MYEHLIQRVRDKKSKIQLYDYIFLRNIEESTKEVRILGEVTGIRNFLTESEQKTLEQFVHAMDRTGIVRKI